MLFRSTKSIFRELLQIVDIADTSKQLILSAMENNDFSDFEDSLQSQAAEFVHAEYIITRDTKHFEKSVVPVLTPQEFLEIVSQ